MGIYSFLNRTSKKDEQITLLNEQIAEYTVKIATLEADAKEQERTLAAKDVFIAALKADKQRLEEDRAHVSLSNTHLSSHVKGLQAENSKLMQEVSERGETITELGKDVVARDEHIRELELAQSILPDELLILLRKIDKRMIRMDRYGGKEFYDEAQALLKQHGSASDK